MQNIQKPPILLDFQQQLSSANPLHKRTLRKPCSIFPFVEQLPQFKYTQQSQYLHSLNISQPQLSYPPVSKNKKRTISLLNPASISPKKQNNQEKILELEETQLKKIFEKTIFSYNQRLSKGENKQFANLKIHPEESSPHENLKNIQKANDSYNKFKAKVNKQQFNESENQTKEQIQSLLHEQQQNLQFQSRFESGNLAFASKCPTRPHEYYLLLTKDFNTAECTQWFFFQIKNKIKQNVRFHILNFFKNYSAFESGMQLCICTKSTNFTWSRGGENIKYSKTNIKIDSIKNLYALTFDYQFEINEDIVYFAYSFPYTFTQLDKFLLGIEENNKSDKISEIFKRQTIGESLGGNPIEMLSITNFKSSKSSQKRLIFITCRIHPGQTPSSFIIEGIIQKLLEDKPISNNLRQRFIFKFIPMLNPDGVINGNYRCSLSGWDMNRVWNMNTKIKFPEIYSVKKCLQYAAQKPFIYIDLHAHSKKKGVFMYGCNLKNNPYFCRQIPFLFWKNIQEFNYFQCNFSMNKKREGTARINIFKEFNVLNSFTMQTSFCGPLKQRKHFTAKNYKDIGMNLMNTLEKYYCQKKNRIGSEDEQYENLFKQLYNSKDFLKFGEAEECESSSDSELEAKFEIQEVEQNQNLKKETEKKTLPLRLNWGKNSKNDEQSKIKHFREGNLSARTTLIREKCNSDYRINRKLSQNYDGMHPISKVGLNLDEWKKNSQNYMSEHYKHQQKQQKKYENQYERIKPTPRYTQDDVNNLTNLFLPSVTSLSYKKYGKPKTIANKFVQVGRKFLQTHQILKPEIQSVSKRKIDWKTQGKTFL